MIETICYQAFVLLCKDSAFPKQQNLYFFAGIVLSPTINFNWIILLQELFCFFASIMLSPQAKLGPLCWHSTFSHQQNVCRDSALPHPTNKIHDDFFYRNSAFPSTKCVAIQIKNKTQVTIAVCVLGFCNSSIKLEPPVINWS